MSALNRRMSFVLLFSVAFILGLTNIAAAQDKCIFSTIPGKVNGIEGWLALKFAPDNPEEINPGGTIEINVLDGRPPFSWGEPGNGYLWVNGALTNSRTNLLQCATGS